jgi:pimeloyl-ACP methyl ester carboxylesterase
MTDKPSIDINELVIVQHGFLGQIKRFDALKNYLVSKGYYVLANQIKTAGRPLDSIFNEFRVYVDGLDLSRYNKVHIIAHSLGCPLTRMYLANHNIPNLDTVILIAGPNNNLKYKPGPFWKTGQILSIFRPLQDLNSVVDIIPEIKNNPYPAIGVLAGSKSNLPTARDIEGVNDGLIAVHMTVPPRDRVVDMKVLPYNHFEIYQKPEVFPKLLNFIRNKKF